MKLLRGTILFYIGGTAYMILEFLWRGRSHGSMFLLGGACFLLVGAGSERWKHIPLPVRLLLSSGIITALELATGLLFNRDFRVWDYRNQPFQYRGQICLAYSLLWIPVSFVAMGLYHLTSKKVAQKLR